MSLFVRVASSPLPLVVVMAWATACGRSSVDSVSTSDGDRTDNRRRPTDGGSTSAEREPNAADGETSARDAGGSSNDEPASNNDEPASNNDEPASSSDGGTNPSESRAEPAESLRDPEPPATDCNALASQPAESSSIQAYSVSPDVVARVECMLQLMSPAQKASQMMGLDGSMRNWRDIMRSPDVEVAGVGLILGYRYRDAGRGVNLDAGQDNRPDDGNNFATVFPTASLRAASWDLDLERRIGAAIGDETAASRNNALLAPTMNIVRHPFWGRTQETYGEDTYHIGRMATAFTVGVQEYVVACARHFAANNIEKQRYAQNSIMTEQTLREIYGRHFEMVVQDGGVGCIMAAYNLVNGVKSTQNEHLIRGILKAPIEQGGMGFEGFVLTDWWAMPGEQNVPSDAATAQAIAIEAVNAGTDVEVPWWLNYNEATLANANQELVEEAARRVLTQKVRFRTALNTDAWSIKPPTSTLTDSSIAPNQAHEALAEEAVVKSAVLLANGLDAGSPVLPLTSALNIAVIGPDQQFSLVSSSVPRSCVVDADAVQGAINPNPRQCTFHFATDPALGDRASSRVNADPTRSVGPFQGIQEVAGTIRTVTSGNSAEAAANAEAVVVVVGYTPGDEGEEYPIAGGGDRTTLNLPAGHNELVSSVLDLDRPTVIIIESGSIVNLPWLSHANRSQATIWASYPGQRGGIALGKLIFGDANFAGKMPMAWPAEAELLPFKDTETATNMGYFFGYREFDRRQYIEGTQVDLLFPFGHGLSYSTFEYSNLVLPGESARKDASFNVSIDIANNSMVGGDEIAMLFVKPPPTPIGLTGERPWKELKSFARVSVPAGQTVTAELPLRIRDLRHWEGAEDGRWVIDSGDYTILVGKDAADAETTPNLGVLTVDGD
jgi:beta-glucosidase